MIGKSLANDFQYTKLKYKQYLYFSLNIPLMFLLCFFLFSLFISPCFFFVYLSLSFSLNLIHFYLIYYQESIIKLLSSIQQKLLGSSEKNRKQNSCFAIPCNKKAVLITHYWQTVLITGRQYSLLVIQISSRSQISSKVQIFEILVFAFFR